MTYLAARCPVCGKTVARTDSKKLHWHKDNSHTEHGKWGARCGGAGRTLREAVAYAKLWKIGAYAEPVEDSPQKVVDVEALTAKVWSTIIGSEVDPEMVPVLASVEQTHKELLPLMVKIYQTLKEHLND